MTIYGSFSGKMSNKGDLMKFRYTPVACIIKLRLSQLPQLVALVYVVACWGLAKELAREKLAIFSTS